MSAISTYALRNLIAKAVPNYCGITARSLAFPLIDLDVWLDIPSENEMPDRDEREEYIDNQLSDRMIYPRDVEAMVAYYKARSEEGLPPHTIEEYFEYLGV